MPNVQWKTPDDGQRNCPKHVEFDKNQFGKLVRLLVLLKIKIFFVSFRLRMTLDGAETSSKLVYVIFAYNKCAVINFVL